jgi:hypothetical protein
MQGDFASHRSARQRQPPIWACLNPDRKLARLLSVAKKKSLQSEIEIAREVQNSLSAYGSCHKVVAIDRVYKPARPSLEIITI